MMKANLLGKLSTALVTGALLTAVFSAPSFAEGFTEEQAAAGKAKFGQNCQRCHAGDLTGNSPFPPITGDRFFGRWGGRTVNDRFNFVSTRMPFDRPGQLDKQAYVDIIAFWLSFNGYTPGNEALTNDPERMKQIVIQPQS